MDADTFDLLRTTIRRFIDESARAVRSLLSGTDAKLQGAETFSSLLAIPPEPIVL
jgi:hypothetical protein